MNNKSTKIQRRSQLYFRPDMNEKKICMFFRIYEEKDQSLPHILETNGIFDFMKSKQVDSYPVNGLEFTFNIPTVNATQISKMFTVIKLFEESVEDITIRISNTLEGNFSLDEILQDEIKLKKQLSLTFDWNSVQMKGCNKEMLAILNAFKQISILEDIKKLNIQFAKVRQLPHEVQEIVSFVTSLKKVEDLKLAYTNYISNVVFTPLNNVTAEQSSMIKKLDLDFINCSLGKNGSQYLSSYISGCKNLDSVKLNLRYNRLEDNDLILILQSLEDKENIQNLHLSLSSNCFKEEGSNYIVHFLSNFASLAQLKQLSLDLKLFEILNEEISLNLFSIFSKITQLTQLTLNFQRISIPLTKECLIQFSQSLGQMTNLKQLTIDLSWSNIKHEIIPLFTQIGNLTQLTHLNLSLLGIPFGERKMKLIENSIQQLKSLQMLTLTMDLRNTYRGNHQIYSDLIQIIERELTPLMNFQLTEMNEISQNYYINVQQMYGRVQQKILLRKQLVYSILLLKKLFMIGKIKRKEMIEDFASFLMQPKYFKEQDNFIPPAPEILELIQ